jgi:hypothetical protein
MLDCADDVDEKTEETGDGGCDSAAGARLKEMDSDDEVR